MQCLFDWPFRWEVISPGQSASQRHFVQSERRWRKQVWLEGGGRLQHLLQQIAIGPRTAHAPGLPPLRLLGTQLHLLQQHLIQCPRRVAISGQTMENLKSRCGCDEGKGKPCKELVQALQSRQRLSVHLS